MFRIYDDDEDDNDEDEELTVLSDKDAAVVPSENPQCTRIYPVQAAPDHDRTHQIRFLLERPGR